MTDKKLEMYQPLPPETIRILDVEPGHPKNELYCKLVDQRIPLHDESGRLKPLVEDEIELGSKPYTALSYCWGADQSPSKPIHIRIADGEYRTLNIRLNLYHALTCLRSRVKSKRYWIDAICINQENTDEKSHQLPLMSRIYNRAKKVCVWLGAETETTQFAFEFVSGGFRQLALAETKCEQWIALAELMQRKWFSRRWVLQEIIMAKQATLCCGIHRIHWEDFAEAVALFEVMIESINLKFRIAKYDHHPEYFGNIRELGAYKMVSMMGNIVEKNEDGLVVRKSLTLEALVSGLTSFECGSPRDIIYAVISLANDVFSSSASTDIDWTLSTRAISAERFDRANAQNLDITRETLSSISRKLEAASFPVDFRKTSIQVCLDFLNFTTVQSKSLDIICRPWAPPMMFSEQPKKLPTWIRTLDNEPVSQDYHGYRGHRVHANGLVGQPGQSPYQASRMAPGMWKFGIDQRSPVLTVKGFQLDEIVTVEGAAQGGVIPREWLSYANLEGARYDSKGTEKISSAVSESFWRTMVAGKDSEGRNPPYWYRTACAEIFAFCQDRDIDLGHDFHKVQNPLQKEIRRRVLEAIWNRRLTRTARRKRLALVPRGTERGDIVCILLGCSVPIVLRKVAGSVEESYIFVGESYVHGMMAGEAFDIKDDGQDEYLDCQNFKIR